VHFLCAWNFNISRYLQRKSSNLLKMNGVSEETSATLETLKMVMISQQRIERTVNSLQQSAMDAKIEPVNTQWMENAVKEGVQSALGVLEELRARTAAPSSSSNLNKQPMDGCKTGQQWDWWPVRSQKQRSFSSRPVAACLLTPGKKMQRLVRSDIGQLQENTPSVIAAGASVRFSPLGNTFVIRRPGKVLLATSFKKESKDFDRVSKGLPVLCSHLKQSKESVSQDDRVDAAVSLGDESFTSRWMKTPVTAATVIGGDTPFQEISVLNGNQGNLDTNSEATGRTIELQIQYAVPSLHCISSFLVQCCPEC
jgi:hypothetical protein